MCFVRGLRLRAGGVLSFLLIILLSLSWRVFLDNSGAQSPGAFGELVELLASQLLARGPHTTTLLLGLLGTGHRRYLFAALAWARLLKVDRLVSDCSLRG